MTINSGTGDVQFGNAVGATNALGSINITGNLDLNAAIIGASSVDVSGTSILVEMLQQQEIKLFQILQP